MNKILLGLIVASLMGGSVHAKEFWPNTVWKNAETSEKRLKLASDMRISLKTDELMKAIPNLSPKEEEWLRKEYSAGGNRTSEAINSDEWVIQQARRLVENVDAILKGIQAGKHNELGYWIQLAYLLNDPSKTEYSGILCERGLIKPCPYQAVNGDYRSAATFWPTQFSSTILLGVIGPEYGLGFQNK
jgi:hypothetical protein